MNLNTIHRKAQNLANDLEALRDGVWEPDDDSLQASCAAANVVAAAFPIIHDMAEMLSDIYEWLETGKVDGVGMDAGMLLAAMTDLNNKIRAHE